MDLEKILVASSNEEQRGLITNALKDHFSITEANHGFEAIRVTRDIMPVLIIIDVDTPGLDGIDFCRRLKSTKATKDILIILISSLSNKEEIIYGLQAGADDYFTTPLNQTEILNRVNAHLNYSNLLEGLEYRDLKLLMELSNTISVMRNPKKILKMVVDKVADIIEVDRCSIVNIVNNNEFTVKASNDLDTDKEISLDLEGYPEIRKAYETRNAIVVNNTSKNSLMKPVRDQMMERGFNSIIVVPIIKKESVIGSLFLGTASKTQGGISERVYKLCHLVANISANALENAVLFESMASAKDVFEDFITRDGLTRLFSHRHFYSRLENEFSRVSRYKLSLSLVHFNIDNFREFNNKHGHIQGDDVLKQIGRMVRSLVRESDVPTRYAGDEFSIILPNTNEKGGLDFAKRLKKLIDGYDFLTGENAEKVTVSIGVANYEEAVDSYNELAIRAQEAMQSAKRQGKGQIVTYQSKS